MQEAMKPDRKFKAKLDALVNSIAIGGRAHVEETIATVVNAGGISDAALVEMLLNRSLNSALRLDVCWLLPRLRVEAAGDVLKGLMSDPLEQIREAAAFGLGLISEEGVVEILQDSVEHDSSRSVRLAALHGLGVLSSPQSAVYLIGILQNLEVDDEIRANAAEALAHVTHDDIVNALIGSLQDSSSLVRYSAAYALGQQGDSRALPALEELASHDQAHTPFGSVVSCARDSIKIITE